MKPHRHFLSLCLLLLGAALPASAQVPPFDMTEISAPGTTNPLLMTASDWQWEDFSLFGPDITYNVSRRIPGDDFRCLISSLTAPNWTGDPQDPAPGEVFFYTITGDDTWGENRHGSSIPIVERCPCSGLPPVAGRNIRLELVAGGFDRPVEVVSSPGDRSRLFVVEQHTGRIRVIQRGNVLGPDFLRVGNLATGNEQGLLSLAFHPDYETNGRLFVYYTERAGTAGLTVLEEFAVSADPNVADPIPMQRIFTLDQPFW